MKHLLKFALTFLVVSTLQAGTVVYHTNTNQGDKWKKQYSLNYPGSGLTTGHQFRVVFKNLSTNEVQNLDFTLNNQTAGPKKTGFVHWSGGYFANGTVGMEFVMGVPDQTEWTYGITSFYNLTTGAVYPIPQFTPWKVKRGDNIGVGSPAVVDDGTVTVQLNAVEPTCSWNLLVQLDKVCPTDGVPHTLEVSDGTTTYGPISIPGDADSVTGNFNAEADNGAVVTTKLDGVVIQTDTVGCFGDPPPDNLFNVSGTIGAECPPSPTPTPTPTPTPPPTPSPTPFPTPGTTPPYQQPSPPPPPPPNNTPQPPPQSTPMPTDAGNVRITNADEIYKPIIDAINGVGQAPVPAPDVNDGFVTGDQPAAIANDQSSTIQESLDAGRAKHGEAVSSGKGKLESLQPLQLPQGISNKYSWAITLPKLGSFVIDISPYASIISIMRALLLMVLLIGVWFSTVKIIRSAIA
jgi:hypothetical protein